MSIREEDAIVVQSLTKRYGDLLAVNDVSFSVRRGEMFALLGPNGAGKTTTAEIIETLRLPTSGSVRVLGMDVTRKKRDIVRRIGVLPQGFSSFDRITVGESLRYYTRLFGRKRTADDDLMRLTDLTDWRDVQFRRLSGGLKQRLGIAIALVNDPEVVFLDEPTTGLDPHARREVWGVLRGLKAHGKAVFLTTHYIEEAELLADTVAVILKGSLVASGSPAELISRYATDLRLTLTPVDEGVVETIRRMGFGPIEVDQGRVTFRVRRTEDVHELLSALKASGGRLPGVDVRTPNLEEVFLGLTDTANDGKDAPVEGSTR